MWLLGKYKGYKFLDTINHDLGYCAWFANSLKQETESDHLNSFMKFEFLRYLTSFPEGVKAMAQKANEQLEKRFVILTFFNWK